MDGSQRQGGVLVDVAQLNYQLGLRGISRRRLCELSGIPEPTLSRACHGRPIREGTLRRLTEALLGVPLMVGADLLITAPATSSRPGAHSQAAAMEVAGGTSTDAAPLAV